jgi:UDP-2,3-diacylglucosamine pyrophosphatase LpxH
MCCERREAAKEGDMPGKFKIVISDLHLSAGHEAEGNRLEDFGSDREFVAFVDELVTESERDDAEAELIVNGDAFEMLQVPHVDEYDPAVVYAPEQYHSSSEEDSVRKMAIIIDGHRPFFNALGRFIRTGPPRRYVTFVKGNHDVNLHWVDVQDLIREAMGATGGRRSLLNFEERRVSREGIYVEHGNQYASVTDQIDDMEEPHDHDRPGQLAIPPGSWFVMDVFNQVERERYWIDGVKPISALVWYALAFDFPFAARAIATLARALPGILDEVVFSFEAGGEEGLIQQLEDPTRIEDLARQYETDEAFRARFNAELEAMLSETPLSQTPLPQTPLPQTPLPQAAGPDEAESFGLLSTGADPVAMGDKVRDRINSSLYEIAAKRAKEEKVKLVTFGHTHGAGLEPLPDGGVYINSGTWTWIADLGGDGKEKWRELFEHPEQFTNDRRLSYVRINYDEAGEPSGELLSFKPDEKPNPEPSSEALSLWDRITGWFRRLWVTLTGSEGQPVSEVSQ